MNGDRNLLEVGLSKLIGELEGRSETVALPAGLRLRQAFERLVVADPKSAADVMASHPAEISQTGPDLGNMLARTLLERKMHKEASRLLHAPGQTKLISDAAICIRLAKALAQEGNSAGAAQAFRSALAIDSNSGPAIRGLYDLAARASRPEEASHWLTRLAEADSSYPTVSYVHKERQKLPAGRGRAVRIALLSSYVLDWLRSEERRVGKGCRCRWLGEL